MKSITLHYAKQDLQSRTSLKIFSQIQTKESYTNDEVETENYRRFSFQLIGVNALKAEETVVAGKRHPGEESEIK